MVRGRGRVEGGEGEGYWVGDGSGVSCEVVNG